MKEDWETKPLGIIVDVLDKLRKPITKRDRVAGPHPYYGATGVLDHVDGYIFDEPLVLIGEDGAKWGPGDVSAFPIDGKSWVNNHAHVLRPHRDELLDAFLIYYLNFSDLSDFISGMTVPKLNQGRLREIPIPLPPLEEQQRIVAILDEAFEGLDRAKANAEANLASAKELFQAALGEALSDDGTWNSTDMKDTFDLVRKPAKVQRKEYLESGKFPIVSQEAELVSGYWNDPEAVISEPEPVIVFGDHTRCVKLIDFPFVAGADGTQIMRPKSFFDLHFFYYMVRNIDLEGKGYARHFSHLKKIRVSFPAEKSQQESISRSLIEIERQAIELELQYRAQLDRTAELRQSLLRKAFAGELT